MNKKQRAILYLEKQKNIEVQMMNQMKNYINSKDKKYAKLKRNHVEMIDILDYIIINIKD